MSDQVQQKNIGALVVEATSILASEAASAAVNGTAIDRQAHSMPLSCVLKTSTGADTGAPSTLAVQSKLQHSPDNSTWTDFLYDGTNTAQGAAITAVNTDQNYAVDLTLANRYLRVVTSVAFTGGTSPAIVVHAGLILGGEQTLAAV